ncbi:MAG: shikimate kinase [Gemmatimonadota bacterium]
MPSQATPAHPFRRILLVGFMGSGKSTVGPLLAEALGWEFKDADRVVETVEGRGIAQIFTDDGEAEFRRVEHRVTMELLREDDLVVASGGGWPCREQRMEAIGDDTLSIWLRVGPERSLERVQAERHRRPLLDVDDPLAVIDELLADREPYYSRARWSVDTDRHSPLEIVRRVLEHLRTEPERPLHT